MKRSRLPIRVKVDRHLQLKQRRVNERLPEQGWYQVAHEERAFAYRSPCTSCCNFYQLQVHPLTQFRLLYRWHQRGQA